MVGGVKEGEDARIFVNPLVDSPSELPDKNSAQVDPVSLPSAQYLSCPAGDTTAAAEAQPNLSSVFAAPQDPDKQNGAASGPNAAVYSGGWSDHKAIRSAMNISTIDYVQPPRLMGHGELFLDRVFTQSDWDAHISFRRYLPEPVVMYDFYFLLVLFACAIYEELIRKSAWPSLVDLEAAFAYNLCSFALSLLLIFKTNTSYARFWEARSQWGAVYTDCRAFILKVQGLAPKTSVPVRRAIVRWTIALPYTMRCHLMDYKPGSETLQELLTETEVEWLRKSPWSINRHHPIRAVGVLLSLLDQTRTDPIHVMHLSTFLHTFLGRCGACERIKATPIPMPYTRHTTRFILIYTFFMPIVLWKNLRWGVFFVAPLITLLLAGIDNIGIFIENPIHILPMSSYCRVVHDNIILAAHDWSLNNSQDAASLVQKCLQETAPKWQQGGEAHDLTDCAGSIVDGDEKTLAPAIYRPRHTAEFDRASVEHSRIGTLAESVASGRLLSHRGRRESSASGKETSVSFRSQSGQRLSV